MLWSASFFFTLIIENASLFSQFATIFIVHTFQRLFEKCSQTSLLGLLLMSNCTPMLVFISSKKIFEERPEMKTIAEHEATNFYPQLHSFGRQDASTGFLNKAS